MRQYEQLHLDRQLCFPLYLLSKELTKLYHKLLAPLDLTYTQYIVMLVIWEHRRIEMRSLGKKLHLNSNTLTPLLERLTQKGYIERMSCQRDARNVLIELTDAGEVLRNQAASIPIRLREMIPLENDELKVLHSVLHRAIEGVIQQNEL